jgi:beta-galactosidase beta subunit
MHIKTHMLSKVQVDRLMSVISATGLGYSVHHRYIYISLPRQGQQGYYYASIQYACILQHYNRVRTQV